MGIIDTKRNVIVLLNMGGPSTLKDVRPFLYQLFADRDLIDLPVPMKPFQKIFAGLVSYFRSKGTKKMYRQIGGGSPILSLTKKFGANLQSSLSEKGFYADVKVAMRYTEPNAESVVNNLDETDHVVLFPQYPHYAKSTSGSSIKDFLRNYNNRFPHLKEPTIINEWGMEPFYVNWWVDGIRNEVQKLNENGINEDIHVIFTSHGLPMSYIKKGETYEQSIDQSREKIIEKVQDLEVEFHQAYQSRAGPFPWLQPYTDELIEELSGSNAVVMVPLGFVTDHVETSYEIDILYGDLASKKGIANFSRVPVPNDDIGYTKAVADFLIPFLFVGEKK